VHHGAADRAGEHGPRDPGVLVGVVQQHPVQAVHKLLERFMFGQQSNNNGIELQRPHQTSVANRHLDHAYQQRVAGLQLVAACLGFVKCRYQPAQFALGDREHDVLLGPKLVVDSSFGDPDGIGDHLQRGAADAVLGEKVQRGIEYSRPGRAVRDDLQPNLANGRSR
jgi:hypothetical protein